MTHTAGNAWAFMASEYKKLRAYSPNFLISLMGLPLVIIANLILWGFVFQFGAVAEMTFNQVITYQIIAFILMSFIFARDTAYEVNGDIVEGGIIIYQVRPIHYIFYRFFTALTRFLVYGAFSIVLIFISSFFIKFELSSSVLIFLFGIISCFFAFCIVFLQAFLIGCVGLWWEYSKGLFNIYSTITYALAGNWLPLDFFPHVLRNISAYLPFQYISYVPVKIFMGAYGIEEVLKGIGIQFVWIIIFFALAMFVWEKGIKNFTGYGA